MDSGLQIPLAHWFSCSFKTKCTAFNVFWNLFDFSLFSVFRSIFSNSFSVYHVCATSSDVIFFACNVERTLTWFWNVTRFLLVDDDRFTVIDDMSLVNEVRLIEAIVDDDDEVTVEAVEATLVIDDRFTFCVEAAHFPSFEGPAPTIFMSCFLIDPRGAIVLKRNRLWLVNILLIALFIFCNFEDTLTLYFVTGRSDKYIYRLFIDDDSRNARIKHFVVVSDMSHSKYFLRFIPMKKLVGYIMEMVETCFPCSTFLQASKVGFMYIVSMTFEKRSSRSPKLSLQFRFQVFGVHFLS